MGTTTLRKLVPKSETHHRKIQADAHRRRGVAGDEAAATTHDHMIDEIREGRVDGDSRRLQLCVPCSKRGQSYLMIEVDGVKRCGTCGHTQN